MRWRRLSCMALPVLALCCAAQVRADEPPTSRPTPGEEDEAKDAPPAKAPDLVPPPPELARQLAAYEDEAEPERELKRAYLSILHYLLARDLERLLPYFHPDLRMHVGQGDLQPLPPPALRRLLREQLAAERSRGAEAPPPLAEVLVKGSLEAYSRARALEVDGAAEGWRDIEPARVAKWMEEGDWLVLAKIDHPDLPREVFYVFRRDGERFKAVLAE